jgi:hypothetical protein
VPVSLAIVSFPSSYRSCSVNGDPAPRKSACGVLYV